MINGYLHLAMMHGDCGLMVAAEMHGRIMQSGIYDASDKIHVLLIGDNKTATNAVDYIFSRYPKYEPYFFSLNPAWYEWPTLQLMRQHSLLSDGKVWYAHSKGVSNCRDDVPDFIQHNIRAWRSVMSYYVLGEHKLCSDLLDMYDAVGPLISNCNPRYFVGNFWWATYKHIRSLPYPQGSRNEAEGWIGTNPQAKLLGLCDCPLDPDLYDFKKIHPEGTLVGYPGFF